MTEYGLIFNGNEKQVHATPDPDKVIIRFKDVTCAFNNIKRARFEGKGVIDNKISSLLLSHLNACGIPTHFISRVSDREQLCHRVEAIPIEVVVHNRMAGTLAAKLGVEDGFKIGNVIVDLCFNNEALGDPLINEDQAVALSLATYPELEYMKTTARKVNGIVSSLMHKAGIELVDMKLEFGRDGKGNLEICDEISPDTCRLWDEKTSERLDKDRFRRDLSDVVASYRTVLERLEKVLEENG